MALLSSFGAPTASVEPSADSAIEEPKSTNPGALLDALTYDCCIHVVPLRTNTYAAPASSALLSASSPPRPWLPLSSWYALDASVDPSADNASANPNRSPD